MGKNCVDLYSTGGDQPDNKKERLREFDVDPIGPSTNSSTFSKSLFTPIRHNIKALRVEVNNIGHLSRGEKY